MSDAAEHSYEDTEYTAKVTDNSVGNDHLEPVQLEVVRACRFKAKPCRECGRQPSAHTGHGKTIPGECEGLRAQRGCVSCGRNKGDVAHFGAPASFNVLASGQGSGNAMVYANLKKKWEEIFTDLLKASGLPRGLGRVYAEGEITFPDRREDRDQGNFRVVIEKALGDALERGGWLERDNWPRYEFGNLTHAYALGESATRVVLFPAWAPVEPREAQAVLDL